MEAIVLTAVAEEEIACSIQIEVEVTITEARDQGEAEEVTEEIVSLRPNHTWTEGNKVV